MAAAAVVVHVLAADLEGRKEARGSPRWRPPGRRCPPGSSSACRLRWTASSSASVRWARAAGAPTTTRSRTRGEDKGPPPRHEGQRHVFSEAGFQAARGYLLKAASFNAGGGKPALETGRGATLRVDGNRLRRSSPCLLARRCGAGVRVGLRVYGTLPGIHHDFLVAFQTRPRATISFGAPWHEPAVTKDEAYSAPRNEHLRSGGTSRRWRRPSSARGAAVHVRPRTGRLQVAGLQRADSGLAKAEKVFDDLAAASRPGAGHACVSWPSPRRGSPRRAT